VVVAENFCTLNNTENVRFPLEHKRSLWEALLCWEEPDSDRSSLSEASSTIGHTCYPPISSRQWNWSDSSIFPIWVPTGVRGYILQRHMSRPHGVGRVRGLEVSLRYSVLRTIWHPGWCPALRRFPINLDTPSILNLC